MAASRIASSRRLCVKYKYFFYIALLMLGLQLFLGYSFYNSIDVKDIDKYEGMEPNNINPRFDIRQTRTPRQTEIFGKQPGHRPSLENLVSENGGKGPPESLKADPKGVKEPDSYKPKCDIVAKEALSAINRSSTISCRQQIADIACLIVKEEMYVESLPRFCPLKGNDTGTYHGCHKDNLNDRDLSGTYKELINNTPTNCVNFCLKAGFRYAGLQYSRECWCGDSYGKHGHCPESLCEGKCSGDSSQKCGGYLTSRVFSTGLGEKKRYAASLVRAGNTPQENSVRIVFVLTLNGRQARQVIRLLRNIYHPRHFYFLHIDKRQEYLYRELLPLEHQLKNLMVSKTRFSTIWGGASLLQAHLHFMQELLLHTDWEWDYYINLSESDYPIKPVKDLTAFLTQYKSYNFLKSHGRDTARFIQKQGLDQTFYECDNHLWRVGPRKLPAGIRIDGGSDWVCLYRKFVNYIVTTNDKLVTGLKHLYKFTLLPAESFFHTVLVNSEFCTKVVDNNLHLTNWRRKQGCKCQYKHIVDWCGCSPNDFKITDLDRLMNYEEKPTFFARKFEPIINQEIINSLDVYLFGNFKQDMTGLTSYWQNEYHHLDQLNRVRDSYPTFYQSFVRLGVNELSRQSVSCTFRPMKILEANVFYEADHFHGILVLHQVEEVATGKTITMETHMHPKDHYAVVQPKSIIVRLQTLEVGTDFDPKELLFRNYGKLIGPYDDLVLRHVWGPGSEIIVSVAWLDPANIIAASYDVKIPATNHIGSHKPQLSTPLRPGIWQVKVMFNLIILSETSFLVTPLTVFDGQPISTADIHKAHKGPEGYYASKDFSDFRDVLNVQKNEDLEAQAATNARKVGKDLENWIDSLVPLFWQVQSSCALEHVSDSCSRLELCEQTSWSSRSPDPKSDIKSVGAKISKRR